MQLKMKCTCTVLLWSWTAASAGTGGGMAGCAVGGGVVQGVGGGGFTRGPEKRLPYALALPLLSLSPALPLRSGATRGRWMLCCDLS